MTALYTYNLRTDEELRQLMKGCQDSLRELAPYNGTPAGARAIAETRRQMDLIQNVINERQK